MLRQRWPLCFVILQQLPFPQVVVEHRNRIQHHHETMNRKSNTYYAIIKPSKESYSNLTHFHSDPLNITTTLTTGYTRDPMTQHAPSQIDGLCNSLCPATQVSGFLLMVLLRSLGAKQTETRNTAKEKLEKLTASQLLSSSAAMRPVPQVALLDHQFHGTTHLLRLSSSTIFTASNGTPVKSS